MKDKIFIIWSGSKDVAVKVKSILESPRYNYICTVGGNDDNDSRFASVGDTVIQQMNTCNQAIVIFQNKPGQNTVSGNLFFELGYVFASYGAKKVHCVKRRNDQINLPSDFDNSFIEPLEDESDDAFAQGIVEYFTGRQKMSIDENKMQLINNRYRIYDLVDCHYSASGSKCSDYELAQYLLFYMQASQMFGDNDRAENQLRTFKERHHHEFSDELRISVNICLSFFEVVHNIRMEGERVFIDKATYRSYTAQTRGILDEIPDDDAWTFDEWARVFVIEQRAYINLLFAECPENDESRRESFHRRVKEDAKSALEHIKILEESSPCKENNDSIGLLSILRAYLYRNLFFSCQVLKEDEEASQWLALSTKERSALLRNFNRGVIDSKLYETFRMEYYLSMCEQMAFDMGRGEEIDELDLEMDLEEIRDYLASQREEDQGDVYVKKINTFYDSISSSQ